MKNKIIQNNTMTLHFGNKTCCIEPSYVKEQKHSKDNLPLIFQRQVHGNKGLVITQENLKKYQHCITHDSDYLVTNIRNLYIGVLTADCLPIALIDETNKAIGIVHAGWRGTVGKIVINTIRHMQEQYGTQLEEIKVFLGPCALPCCYEIDQQFIDNLPSWAKKFAKKAFDVPACNVEQLLEAGIKKEHIDQSNNLCTICNKNFCSYRKNPSSKARQISIIALN